MARWTVRNMVATLMLAAALALAGHNTAVAGGFDACGVPDHAPAASHAHHASPAAGPDHGPVSDQTSPAQCCGAFCSTAIVQSTATAELPAAAPGPEAVRWPGALPPRTIERPPRPLTV